MDDVTEGYAAIGEVPYQWATAPIRPTDLTGDPAGWFTMMRRLDAPFMETLQRTLDSTTAFEIVPDAAHKTDASVPLRFEELQLAPPRGDFVDASFTVAPLAANQHLTLRISTPRRFIQRMSEISSWFALGSLVLGVLIAMLAIRWLQQRLLSPLARLSDGLLAIGSDVNGDAAARLPAIGHGDEISGVGFAVNRMLDRIESSRDAENARDRAEAASRSKSEFLARMSHEIRTPMNGVLGMTELLRSTRLDTRQQQYTRAIAESAEALLLIINDILDVSKIEAGRMRLDEASFDLEQLMEQSAELLAGRAHQKGLDLICRISPALHMAYRGDAMRLRQILVNLLGNAVKFTPRGQVLLQVETLEGGASGKSILRFEVSDTGIGIRPENQELIFESFSQEDGSTTRRFGGTGLGLSISKQLVGLMHGQIGVRSVVGEGSSFWFTVELEREADGGRTAASEPLAGLRILVVDDNPLNRQILDEQLRGWQVDVVTAEDAAEGLRLLQEFQDAGRSFDLAILDYHMPLMNGMDLVRVMRGRPAFRDLPVVMLSSMSGLAEPDNKSLGVCAWLTKPVRRANLHTALVGVLRPDESFPAATTDNTELPLLGLRVLLVEDNPVNQAVAIGMLEQIACKVRTSADGLDALQCFRQESFDLILMDCQMPELDGYEATRRLRQIEASDGRTPTPVVALTANALEGDRERCLEAGMDEYLSKPFTAQQLLAVIRLVLPALPAMSEEAPASAAPARGRQRRGARAAGAAAHPRHAAAGGA
jgi:signal transduction histidine kinase/CheY-like chemotaxis protein